MPIRRAWMKRYIERYKYQGEKREELLALINESEEQAQEILGDEYVPYLDTMPELKSFIEQIRITEAEKEALRKKKEQEEIEIEPEEELNYESKNMKEVRKVRKHETKKKKRLAASLH